MKESKKVILGVMKKHLEHGDRFESQVLDLTLSKMDGARDDGWGVYYSKGGKRLVMAKKTLEGDYAVKDDTREICENAFWGCAFLRKLAIPASVEKIGDEAFARCISLESVYIPQSVVKMGKNPFVGLDSIGRDAFCDCDALQEVTVPASVRTVDAYAFANCASLRKVTFISYGGEVAGMQHDNGSGHFSCRLHRRWNIS